MVVHGGKRRMTMREKLIELLEEAEGLVNNDVPSLEQIADHLIAHGVTIQKWIPETERLPDTDGKYLVFEQKGGRTVTDTLRFTKDASKVSRYDFKGMLKNLWYGYDSEWGYYAVRSVTHWMPLPEPPKGE
jgi:hypothetical protein